LLSTLFRCQSRSKQQTSFDGNLLYGEPIVTGTFKEFLAVKWKNGNLLCPLCLASNTLDTVIVASIGMVKGRITVLYLNTETNSLSILNFADKYDIVGHYRDEVDNLRQVITVWLKTDETTGGWNDQKFCKGVFVHS
jgi:hypothetical protein